MRAQHTGGPGGPDMPRSCIACPLGVYKKPNDRKWRRNDCGCFKGCNLSVKQTWTIITKYLYKILITSQSIITIIMQTIIHLILLVCKIDEMKLI